MPPFDLFFDGIECKAAHAVSSVLCGGHLEMLHRAGIGWDVWSRHNEGVYSTLCLRRVESCNISNFGLEPSNGRCPGCDYFNPVETL